jgi:hypothetical protein
MVSGAIGPDRAVAIGQADPAMMHAELGVPRLRETARFDDTARRQKGALCVRWRSSRPG